MTGDTSTGTTPREVSAWNVPNALTVLRLAMVPVFAWALLAHPDSVGWRVASTAIFVVAIFTDFVDGKVARKYDLVTSFGKLADPIADKALTGMAFIGLSVLGELPWWITIVILVREWGITVLRFVVIRHGVIAADRGGKAKTALQAVALTLFLLPLLMVSGLHWVHAVGWVVMIAALVLTVLTGANYVRSALRLRRGSTTSS
ncbi:MAG: CDP-diacylglycerol--glycerol-3-phosphate 3-phosphatidyltransferase [Janthinobacterium lividum]